MNEGKTFFDLPQATEVPAGSRYAVEMGDGTGTKSVTHEDVVKAVGGDLPLGDTKDLETLAKDTFVDAINEIKRRTDSASGGATIKVVTTDPGLYGRVVSVTDGETTLTGSMSYTGECVISGVLINGNLTISAATEEGATDESVVYVSAYATYTVELDTRVEPNWINVSTPESALYGAVVTASNGVNTVKATIDNDGTTRIKCRFSGNVTVTATDGQNTVSASVIIASEGTASYNVTLKLYRITVNTQETTLEGEPVTLTCGEYTKTGKFTDGTTLFVCGSEFTGECELNATDGLRKGHMTVTITEGTYEYTVAFTLAVTYSVLIDCTKSQPDGMITYTDDAQGMQRSFEAWREKEIFRNMRPCVLKDGEVLYYLNPDNFAQKEDGPPQTSLRWETMSC